MKLKALIAGVAATALLAGAANAATYVYTATGLNGTEGVDAKATIDVSAGGATITLQNLFANPTSIASSISGIQLFFDTTPLTSSLASAAGTEITFFCDGKTTGCNAKSSRTTGTSDNVIGHWGSTVSGGSVFLATAGTGAAGGGPFDLIVGPGPYTKFNSSITGDNPHIKETGVFSIAFTGLTAAPTITGVNLLFGTGPGSLVATGGCTLDCGGGGGGTGDPVPEPATWAMMIMGFGGVGALMRRRRSVFA